MKNGKMPDPNVIHPIAGYDKEIYVKPILTCSEMDKVKEEIKKRIE